VMILHDLNIAAEYCQRLLLLDGGRVCRLGLPEDVLTYEIIERVYKTVVLVKRHPVSLKPCVFLVPEAKRGAHA